MGSTNPYVRIEFVTPEKAANWLKLNTHNRDLQPGRVKNLAGAISRGEWKLNGDSFVFSNEGDGGKLLNGQHRAHAIVQAGTTVPVVVLYNAESAAQETMDSGQGRSLGQKLKLRNESYYNDLQAALTMAFAYDIGGEPRVTGAAPGTHQQLLNYLEQNPEIRENAHLGMRLRKEFGTPAGSWMGWAYLFSRQVGQATTEEFFDRLISGVELEASNPIYHLRRVLLKWKNTPTDRRLGRRIMAGMTVKAFNAYVLGQDIALLKFAVGESFPTIVGARDLVAA